MTAAQAIDQADRMRAVLTEAGVTSRLFRPPFGEINPEQLSALRRSDYVPIHWSLAVDHYVGGLGMRPSVAAASLFEDLRSGDIILAHDAGTGSSRQRLERRRAVEALDLLLRELEVAGYRVVPVNELLNQGPGVKAKPREWFWQSGFECPRD
jgi:peptidoglycan/xylan/chitin deacetylase (PgdA/CDA1 family)